MTLPTSSTATLITVAPTGAESAKADVPALPVTVEEIDHRYGSNVHLLRDPFLLTLLARLCSPETVQPEINRLVKELYDRLISRVVSAEFPRHRVEMPTRMIASTPRGVYVGEVIQPRTRAVVVDVAVDQGGCIETCKPTTHADPTYVVDGVLHYCVANMPGAVPRTSTFGLTNATGPWARKLAGMGAAAAAKDPVLGTAANVLGGKCTHEAVAQAFDLPFTAPGEVL